MPSQSAAILFGIDTGSAAREDGMITRGITMSGPTSIAAISALLSLPVALPAIAQESMALRFSSSATFTPDECTGPCTACLFPTPAEPVSGRVYLTPVPASEFTWTHRGSFHAMALGTDARVIEGALGVNAMSRAISVETHIDGVARGLQRSTTFPPAPFELTPPFLSVDVNATREGCLTVRMHLVTQPICTADFDDGSGRGFPDDAVGIDDLLYFLAAFERGSVEADLDDGSATGLADSAVTIDDLLYFLRRFEIGC